MSEQERSRYALYRDRKRGGPPQPREVKPHGTWAAVRRHMRAKEPLCPECVEARRAHQREMYKQRKQRSADGE